MRTARDNARVSRLFAAEDSLASLVTNLRLDGKRDYQIAADPEVKALKAEVGRLRAAADDGADPFDGVTD